MQTDRQTDRHTDTDRQTDRHLDGDTDLSRGVGVGVQLVV
jgi:hypothetical protein